MSKFQELEEQIKKLEEEIDEIKFSLLTLDIINPRVAKLKWYRRRKYNKTMSRMRLEKESRLLQIFPEIWASRVQLENMHNEEWAQKWGESKGTV
jgi:hypothetical protein